MQTIDQIAANGKDPKHLPPEEIAPSALWLALTAAPRPSEVVKFPGTNIDVRYQVLTLTEHEACRFTALGRIKDKKFTPDEVPGEVYSDMVATEILARALCNVEPRTLGNGTEVFWPIALNAQHLRDKFTANQLAASFNQYLITQQKYGPSEQTVRTDEEIDAWIKRLVEGGSEFPLAAFSWPQLVELTMSLARRAYTASANPDSPFSNSPSSFDADPEISDSGRGSSGMPPAAT